MNKLQKTSFLIPIFFLVFLSGCAQYQWQKYGANQNELNRDSLECDTSAVTTYPEKIVIQQITAGYTTPSTTNCMAMGRMIDCTTTPGKHVPGVSVNVDLNKDFRKQAIKQCMQSRGWQLKQIK